MDKLVITSDGTTLGTKLFIDGIEQNTYGFKLESNVDDILVKFVIEPCLCETKDIEKEELLKKIEDNFISGEYKKEKVNE